MKKQKKRKIDLYITLNSPESSRWTLYFNHVMVVSHDHFLYSWTFGEIN